MPCVEISEPGTGAQRRRRRQRRKARAAPGYGLARAGGPGTLRWRVGKKERGLNRGRRSMTKAKRTRTPFFRWVQAAPTAAAAADEKSSGATWAGMK